MYFERAIFFRILSSIVLAGIAVWLFIESQSLTTHPHNESEQNLTTIAQVIDRSVDDVLAQFGIKQELIHKRAITVPDAPVARIERQVTMPREVLPVQINIALNTMAHRFNGRAVGNENTKEHSVTLYIVIRRTVVQTIILKQNLEPDKKQAGNRTRA